ncbi:RHS repeat-associated core domain-containing protein [Nonomuraea solani]|uniref:RHS repeat-associated core domain-containing protein n=1 Tax=Nonomuraea solani TaxID=1144553 RepID=A0A1H5U6R7_9ACTN|nr:SpvB/TcaC N-terminal domain-containing protein [Nonomuraea solani]SEF70746.1 RHS repeat-associated core domain-containing protein [Nonomuraea solani]
MNTFRTRVLALVACLTLVTSCLASGMRPVSAETTLSTSNCVAGAAPLDQRKAERPAFRTTAGKAARTLTHDEARLEIGAEALGSPTEIGVTPLSEAQLPALGAGMENVTKGPRRGYRFTPTPFEFKRDITVSLPYDPAALKAAGLSPQDVRTYYFDEKSTCWRALERVSIDEQAGLVVSRTNHFTDMVNAAVVAPESPEQVSFDPTQIKGLQAATPATGVNQIAPPVADNRGESRLSYPLELPAGRAGLAPSLAIAYSSGATNGWLGLGWDVTIPSISVDSRWGVPRYDARTETETYSMMGEQLSPVAHRGTPPPRTANKVFRPRIEGRFDRIVRLGDSPRTYTWEVTDKAGVRRLYGGEGATLADDQGNVFTWALREVRDRNDNTVRYHYTQVDDAGIEGGSVTGRALYPKKITYTGRGNAEGPYAVTFVRDRELGEPRRSDVSVTARGGFKQVTADLLRRVEVTLNGEPVRAYELTYTKGAFLKTLLSSVKQFDADGKAFTAHEFGYFDDIRDASGAYQAFAKVDWTSPDDNVVSGAVDAINDGAGEAGAINGNASTGGGGHLYVGWGPRRSKSGSIGVKAGYSRSSDKGLLALLDVDGDHLPDKVFQNGGGFGFRKNLARPGGQPRFAAEITPLQNLPGILGENASTRTVGAEAYPGAGALQLNYVDTISTTGRYFSDVNGDGIPDLVNGGAVLFGRVAANGAVAYGAAADTPVPIGSSTVAANGLLPDYTEDAERRAASFPLVDSVRRWTAPYTGTVGISGAVTLKPATQPRPDFAEPDGVRVAIQREGTELWAAEIATGDHGQHAPAGVDAVQVERGQHLYFRVGSVMDGADDLVAWDPKITYTGLTGDDANGLPVSTYQASEDFTLAGRAALATAPADGTLRLGGAITKKAATSDDVTVLVTREGEVVFEKKVDAAFTGEIPVAGEFAVSTGQELAWRIAVDSPIDVTVLEWAPTAQYTSEDGRPFSVPYDIDTYVAGGDQPVRPFAVAAAGRLSVTPALTVADGTSGTVVFTVKRRNELLAKATLTAGGTAEAVEVDAKAGDELYFDFTAADPRLTGKITGHTVTVGGAEAASTLHTRAEEGVYGRPYRGWAAVGYNGNGARAEQPIKQADLTDVSDVKAQLPERVDPQADRAAFERDPRITPPNAILFAPDPATGRWGAGEFNWVAAAEVSSSRLGGQSIGLPTAASLAEVRAVPRISRTEQISLTGNVGGDVGTVGGSIAEGTSTGELDYLDMNGDGFPDVVGSGGVQYTDPTGVLGATRGELPGGIRSSSQKVGNAGAGSAARTITTGRGHAAPPASTTSNTANAGNDLPPLGIGGDLGSGKSEGKSDLLDINADGLPDRVSSDGKVALNLGYRFAAPEPWPGVTLNDGRSANRGLRIGFNTDFYGLAGGASFSQGDSTTRKSLADVNGDGLADQVSAGNPIKVALNTGTGFADPVDFHGSLTGINADSNAKVGGGLYFSIKIPIAFGLGGYIIINPGADVSTGASRAAQSLRDLDGDGFTDHLASTKDNELTVAANQTGRTNLLKTVKRPLGSSIELGYARAGNTYAQPQSQWVLSSVKTSDGLAGDGPDVQHTAFSYADGVQDRLEREFLGYGRLVTTQLDRSGKALRSTTSTFDTSGFHTRGLLLSESLADGAGKPFTRTENTYDVRDLGGGTRFPQLTRVEASWFEGQAQAGKQTRTEMSYDELGNLTKKIEYGEPGTGDDVETVTGYTTCADTHIVGVPRTLQVRGGGKVMRRADSTVDCRTGNVTQHRALLADNTAAVTDLTYHPTGTIATRTSPQNHRAQRYRLSYTYDDVIGNYVTATTDSFGLTSSATYDLRFGTQLTAVDVNGQRQESTYDAAGRLTSLTGPLERGWWRPTIGIEYHHDATVPYAVTRHLDRKAGGVVELDTIDTITFTDGLGRTVQTKKDATLDGTEAMTVSGRIVFDEFGRAVKQYYPTSERKGTANTTFAAGFDTVRPTVTDYDVLDRTVRSQLPDESVTTTAYGFGNDRAGVRQFEMAVTDAKGNVRRSYVDVSQRTTAVREPGAKATDPPIWTGYAFDPLGQIVTVTDDRGNRTLSNYDDLGRRTAISTPDGGTTTTVYDPAGNPVREVTANLAKRPAAVTYTYDQNRLTEINYPVFTGNNVRYTYGAAGAPGNTAGRVSKIQDGAGEVAREYGPLGEVTKETRTVRGPYYRDFTTAYSYDSFGRVLQLTYKDGEVLTYAYDSGGMITSAGGSKKGSEYSYLKRIDYDKFGQRVAMDLGNGVRTTFAYDAEDRRLATLRSAQPGGHVIQKLGFGYDAVGNVTRLHNDVDLPGHDDHSRLNGPTTQTFTYDNLYRLTAATGAYRYTPDQTDTYTLSMAYDTIHNLTRKAQDHRLVVENQPDQPQPDTTYVQPYTYAAGKAHTTKTVGDVELTYDANGNLTDRVTPRGGQRRQLIWDEENRLACVHDDSRFIPQPQDATGCAKAEQPPTVRFAYDDQGTRVVKDGAQISLYPNQFYTTRGHAEFKHVFVAGTRIVSKTMKADDTFENDQFFYQSDHLGSTAYGTDREGKVSQHLEYFPTGETWVDARSDDQTLYQFTGKELDAETGFTYHGARYYDPRMSQWQSADPAAGSYLDGKPNGGVFRSANLAGYSYAANDPVGRFDPSGNWEEVGHQWTTQAAALAAGLPSQVSYDLGKAAFAPDLDSRVATSWSSLWNQNDPAGHFQSTHLLNRRNALETQRAAGDDVRAVVEDMDITTRIPVVPHMVHPFTGGTIVLPPDMFKKLFPPRFSAAQENALHAFGDAYSHVDFSTAMDPLCPCMFGVPAGHVTFWGAITFSTGEVDNPHTNPVQYRRWLGAVYDAFRYRASKEGLTPRMSKYDFVESMMRDVAGKPDPAEQKRALQDHIKRMDQQ